MASGYVFEAGSVTAMDGSTIRVGVDHDAVWVRSNGAPMNRQQAETFAQLFVHACWAAGRQDTP